MLSGKRCTAITGYMVVTGFPGEIQTTRIMFLFLSLCSSKPDEKVKKILNKLREEGFVKEEEGGYSIGRKVKGKK
ncbi:MAG: hypothetical protein NTX75_02085 [Proteobacteria bacterium]|nr:hypothetical protein [Pseudomonadota bacterium]